VPTELLVLEIVKTVVPALALVALGVPLIGVLARRFERVGASPKSLSGIEDRLARIEVAVDAIAVEVERISEGQRFTAKLLAGRAEGAPGKSTTARVD
jgi:hypothetical protein